MASERDQLLEDFFKLFHEPFSVWAADLGAIRNRKPEEKIGGVTRDDEILHFASLVERLAALLFQEFKEHFALPLPPDLWSARMLQEHFREMNETARHILMQKESNKLKPDAAKKLEWLAELNLDSVLRSGGKR